MSAFVMPLPLQGPTPNSSMWSSSRHRSPSTFPRPRQPQPHQSSHVRLSPRCEITLKTIVLRALHNQFPDQDITRVSQSFQDAITGRTLEKGKGSPQHQRATSCVRGLKTVPFYEEFTKDFAWVKHLEENWTVIRDELFRVAGQEDLAEVGNNIWAPPVVEAANAYGPDWRTLVLQDREWDRTNTKLFPQTAALLRDPDAKVPSVEAFFARQSPNTGIKLHTDDCNFILTMHLPLSAPPQQSWIEVAGERRYWENGKSLVFDTSYFHRTMNESIEHDRVVLLIRFWHPQLSQIERDALSFLFQVIDDSDGHPAMLKAKQQLQTESMSRKRKKGINSKLGSPSGGRGFGR